MKELVMNSGSYSYRKIEGYSTNCRLTIFMTAHNYIGVLILFGNLSSFSGEFTYQ